jgi:hypothetical protein
MQSAAQAALTLNNVELKKRHLSVSIAQARQVGTAKYVSICLRAVSASC